MKADTPAIVEFEEALPQAIQAVRGALTELLVTAGANPERPQTVARRFGLNKNLAWKVCKIINSPDAFAAVPHLPGSGGQEILLSALSRGGAPASSIEAARTALSRLDSAVEVHCGDRATLELMVSSRLPDHVQQERQEAIRKLSFQGNSAIWGVQARARFSCSVVFPSAGDETLVDIATMSGFIGFRRLRSGTRWPLFSIQFYNDDGSPIHDRAEPLDPEGPQTNGLSLLPEFCSQPLPPIEARPMGNGTVYELPPGPVGRAAEVTCVFGDVFRRIGSYYRDERNRYGEHAVYQHTPVEAIIYDLLVHDDLPLEMPPEVLLYSRLTGTEDWPIGYRESERLPVIESVQELVGTPPIVATPLMPEYPQLLERTLERIKVDPSRLRGYRFVLRYPPIPTTILLRYPLAERD